MTLSSFYLIILIISIILAFLLGRRFGTRQKLSQYDNRVVIDTSSLIDGRILDVAKTGFLTGKFYVPKFILEELQEVADSSDPLKRNKGRRGLKILRSLKRSKFFTVEIVPDEYSHIKEIDSRLIELAKDKEAKLLTVDYNLNEVAKVNGIDVLNINELSNAIKPLYLPGEKIEVKVVQKGKERNQGVGYLPDGTMIVVEEGLRFLGRKVNAIVSRIFQTEAGRMIFCRPEGMEIKKRTWFSRPRFPRPRFPRFGRR